MSILRHKDADFDFGFSFSDGTDIPEVQQASNTVNQVIISHTDLQTKYTATMKLINMFLDNLSQDPTKKYLLWPERAARVKAFKDKLASL